MSFSIKNYNFKAIDFLVNNNIDSGQKSTGNITGPTGSSFTGPTGSSFTGPTGSSSFTTFFECVFTRKQMV